MKKKRDRVTVKCDNCGKTFTKRVSQLGKHNFCSRECWLESIHLTKEPLIKKPCLTPSKDLCYILGVLCGDGSILSRKYKHGKYTYFHNSINLVTRNKTFAESFWKSLKSINLNPPPIFSYDHHGKLLWGVRVGSKVFCAWFLSNFVISKGKRKNTTKYNVKKLEEFLSQRDFVLSFLRGFFESDGSYYYETHNLRPFVSFGKSNKQLMELVAKLIRKLGYHCKLYKIRPKTKFKPEGFDYYLIHMRIKDEPEQFIKEIKPVIKNTPSNQWFQANKYPICIAKTQIDVHIRQ